jgi:Domain of unknown function (DUF4169)
MSADVVNLRNFRKKKARVEREARAAENRAKFGQSKPEKLTIRKNTELDARRLDQSKRETRGDDGE